MLSLHALVSFAVLVAAGCATEASAPTSLTANGTTADGTPLAFRSGEPSCIYEATGHQLIVQAGSGAPSGVEVAVWNTHGFGAFELDESLDNGDLSVSFTRSRQPTPAYAPTAIKVQFDADHQYGFPVTSGTCHLNVSRLDGDRATGELSCTNLPHVVDGFADTAPSADIDMKFDCAVQART